MDYVSAAYNPSPCDSIINVFAFSPSFMCICAQAVEDEEQ